MVRILRFHPDAKTVWLGVSIPTFVLVDVNMVALGGILIALSIWAYEHWMAVR